MSSHGELAKLYAWQSHVPSGHSGCGRTSDLTQFHEVTI
jgi:hypothetical protein